MLLQVQYTCYLPNTTVHNRLEITQTTSFTIDDRDTLSPLTDCCVTVYAEATCNSLVHPGEITSACGRTSDTTPLPVQSLFALSVSDHSLFVSWEPPTNYERPGLQYVLSISGQNIMTGQTYYFINSLQPSTSYTIEVRAVSTAGMSDLRQATNMTKPPLPSPPTNVRFSTSTESGSSSSSSLVLEWMSVPSVTHYSVFWKCNELDGNTTTSDTVLNVISYNSLNHTYTWCTARVQSINEIGISDLSEAASSVIPPMPPPQPTCFLVDNKGSSADFSFTVTDPFSLNQLEIYWMLTTGSNMVSNDRSPFVNSTLTVALMRNTNYIFRLRLCNLHGCGDDCSPISFTTNSVSWLVKLDDCCYYGNIFIAESATSPPKLECY